MTTSLEGLDLVALDRHLRDVGVARSGDLRAELISGGRSNLTFLVFDDTSKWVLRRPPLHGLTPSAHDMAREYRVVAALADTPVPVARAVTMRNDDSVLGAPFQMVEYVSGRVVRYADELEALGDKDTISDCVDTLIRALELLANARRMVPTGLTKSGIILGMGEEWDEVLVCMRDLRRSDVNILTLGQYLRPSDSHLPVARYYAPEEFTELRWITVQSGPHPFPGPSGRDRIGQARPVTVGEWSGADWIIASGLAPGDKVIVSGRIGFLASTSISP